MKKSFWVILLCAVLVTGCATSNKSRYEFEEEYRKLDINLNDSYQKNQQNIKNVLQKNWIALTQENADHPELEKKVAKIVEFHTPTDNDPVACNIELERPRGMLLIHGLYDSPYIMKDLDEYFRHQCFHTRSILLPGHGTRPGSLQKFSYKDWVKVVDHSVHQFADDIKGDIYITGFSTGAALALNNALGIENGKAKAKVKAKGIFLFAPALIVEDGLPNFLDNFWFDWAPTQKLDDKDYIKYESITLDSVIQVGNLADQVRGVLENEMSPIDIPVMLVIAKNDYTIKTKTAISLYECGQFGNKSEMIIYAPIKVGEHCVKGVIEGDPDVLPKIPTYISSCFIHKQHVDGKEKEYLIADYSHMALTLKSTDPHYGLEGDYKYCTHYFHNEELEARCKQNTSAMTDSCFGERRAVGSKKYPECVKRDLVVRRLTSNPQFKQMTDYLSQFIKRHINPQH